jgi:hypothetical protein
VAPLLPAELRRPFRTPGCSRSTGSSCTRSRPPPASTPR